MELIVVGGRAVVLRLRVLVWAPGPLKVSDWRKEPATRTHRSRAAAERNIVPKGHNRSHLHG